MCCSANWERGSSEGIVPGTVLNGGGGGCYPKEAKGGSGWRRELFPAPTQHTDQKALVTESQSEPHETSYI